MTLEREDRLAVFLTAALALAAGIWNSVVGLSWTPGLFPMSVVPTCLLAGSAWYRFKRPWETKLSEILLYWGLWFAFPVVGVRLTHLGISAGFPLVDHLCMMLDHAIGFDWVAWSNFVFAHRAFNLALGMIYRSVFWQPFVTVAILAFLGPPRRNSELFTTMTIALGLTIFLCTLLPASGPAGYTGSPIDTDAIVAALRGNHGTLPYQGIICFPSFHTVMALLFTWAHRGHRTFPYFVGLNALMLIAIPSWGNHYLCDVMGGIAVTVGAVVIFNVMVERPSMLRQNNDILAVHGQERKS